VIHYKGFLSGVKTYGLPVKKKADRIVTIIAKAKKPIFLAD